MRLEIFKNLPLWGLDMQGALSFEDFQGNDTGALTLIMNSAAQYLPFSLVPFRTEANAGVFDDYAMRIFPILKDGDTEEITAKNTLTILRKIYFGTPEPLIPPPSFDGGGTSGFPPTFDRSRVPLQQPQQQRQPRPQEEHDLRMLKNLLARDKKMLYLLSLNPGLSKEQQVLLLNDFYFSEKKESHLQAIIALFTPPSVAPAAAAPPAGSSATASAGGSAAAPAILPIADVYAALVLQLIQRASDKEVGQLYSFPDFGMNAPYRAQIEAQYERFRKLRQKKVGGSICGEVATRGPCILRREGRERKYRKFISNF